jgi:hypothetical protein
MLVVTMLSIAAPVCTNKKQPKELIACRIVIWQFGLLLIDTVQNKTSFKSFLLTGFLNTFMTGVLCAVSVELLGHLPNPFALLL